MTVHRPLSNKARAAAHLIAMGAELKGIMEELSISKKTYYNWMNREDFQTLVRQETQRYWAGRAPKWTRTLDKQSEIDDIKYVYAAQNAATTLLNFYGADLKQPAETTIIVHLEGAPELGMPDESNVEEDGEDNTEDE